MDISFQLYSARNFPPVSELLPKLKQLGYVSVEGYAGLYSEVEILADNLNRNDLTMPSGHFGFEDLSDTPRVLDIAGQLGVSKLICPFIEFDKRPETEQGWRDFALRLAELSDTYRAHGLDFAWHNHDFEFAALPSGDLPMDIIILNAPKIGWQFDIAWCVKAGLDPIAWIKKYGQRITSVHLKDIAVDGTCSDEDGWADLGHGLMDWAEIFKSIRSETNCTSFVVEHDNPNDIIRFATRSIRNAQRLEQT